MKKFSIREVFGEAWRVFWENWKFLVPITLVVMVANLLFSFASSNLQTDYPNVAIGVNLVGIVVQSILSIGLVRIALKILRSESLRFPDLYGDYGLFFKYFAASLLSGLAVFVGLLLLVVPGVILAVRLQFWPYFVVSQKLGPIEALKRSWAITSGGFFKLFLLGVAVVAANIAGILLLGIGVLVSAPVTMLVTAIVYRRLTLD